MGIPQDAYKTTTQKQLRDRLILEHLGYVRHILGRIMASLPKVTDQENLEGAGVLGLVEAAQQFDSNRGVEFKTFAYRRIRGAILDELRRNSPLPQKMLRQISQVRRACETLPPPVMPEIIAKVTQLTVEEVEHTIEAMRLGFVHTWDESKLPIRRLDDAGSDGPQSHAEKMETKQVMADAIAQLPERERLVITLYYLEDLRLKEIGKVLNLSESRVCRILSTAQFRTAQLVTANGG